MRKSTIGLIMLLLAAAAAFSLSGCIKRADTAQNAFAEQSEETAKENETPTLREGERVYKNDWAYVYTDVDGNEVPDRISCMRIVNSDDEQSGRLLVEPDYGGESAGVSLDLEDMTENVEVHSSRVTEGTLIIVKSKFDDFEVIAPFMYTEKGRLYAFSADGKECACPDNWLWYSKYLKNSAFHMKWTGDTELEVWHDMSKLHFRASINEKYTGDDAFERREEISVSTMGGKMTYDSETKTVTVSAGLVVSPGIVPVKFKMQLSYSRGRFVFGGISYEQADEPQIIM